ncbi:SusC/RagA family TonB-linked outer membrane protein [Mucilaginibacter sp. SMC90]|uniref:SusC/RagA family TonB-linked outer membrane protein n=1 Tax=Mucilaginibacter sp. SMC90 TaxID=2929803 RepID=UPI001FB38CD5|nr:SusC/RagA family TonB-linked outer membrane protein [Mucilaginibacter sp. SMC90]UOE49672.1 SusC/RagA family TonB-linked outer membrane protein [Mucilaginibacter sp. SMC90]
MKKLLLVSLCLLVLSITQVFAQNRTITGTVTAKDDGQPIPGATVKIKGTTSGTQTGVNGKYSLSVPANATLSFSFIGYETRDVTLGASDKIDVVLSTSAKQLSEVVVTAALGIKRQKGELGYAATSLTSKDVNLAKPVNVINGLQGKVSGLNITTINSGVFEDVKINLRGIRSLLGNNSPLLLLDGVQVPISYISSLNPNDIDTYSILKGSSSAAIYGPDAVNGVIVITTKKGNVNGKPEVTLSNSTQFTSVSKFPAMQNEFGSGDYGGYVPYENWSWGPAFDGSTKEIGVPFDDGTPTQTIKYSALPNEKKNFFNTGSTVINDVSIRTGATYLGIQDANIKGIVPNDKNRRTGIYLNTTQDYGRLKVTAGVNYKQYNYNVFDDDAMSTYNANNNVGLNGGLMNLLFNIPADVPLTRYKNINTDPYAGYNGYFTNYGINPYFALDNWRLLGKREDMIASLELNLKATDWLNFTYRANLTSNTVTERHTSEGVTPNQMGIDRGFTSVPQTLTERSYKYQQLFSQFFASFNKTFAQDFKVTAIVGTDLRQRDNRDTQVGTTSLVIPNLFDISQRTGNLTGSSDFTRDRLFSVYGSAGLSYKGWASVEVTGRNDQTSLLSSANNSFFYPGVSASVVLSEAIPALKNSNTLSYLKLRGAANKSGNISGISAYTLAATFSQTNGFPYGPVAGYTANDKTYDPNIKPEFVKSFEFGFESGFLKDRITLEATYFHQNNTNQIIPIQVSNSTGYTSYQINAASFINKGVELDLGLNPLVKIKDVAINFKANATYNDSRVNSVYQGLDQLAIGGFTNFASNYAVVGAPAFVFKATDYLRDDQGRVIVDANTGYPTADPNVKQFGRTMPLWTVGLSPSFRWKSLTLSATFEYKGGHYVYNDIGNAMAWTGVGAATATNHRERYVLPNSSIADPANPGKYIANTNVTLSNVSDFYTGVYRDVASNFITSADSWRLREISLSYDLPQSLLGKQNVIKGLTIGVTARNLFLWVPKTNIYGDPDFTFSSAPSGSNFGVNTSNVSGVADSQINPATRTIGGNIVVKF